MPRPVYQVKAEFFKTLGHPARIRILEVLREGEHSVGEMIPKVEIESSHMSHQLAILRRANIVRARKVGSAVMYSVADPRIFQLLEVAKQIITGSLLASQDLLADLKAMVFDDAELAAELGREAEEDKKRRRPRKN
jgi:ArsR family transcriptional regulator